LIDSKLLPLEKRESVLLPVGDHKLEIRSEGQPKYVNTFTASKGNNNPIQINLSNKNGETSQEASRFTINSVPSGASVYLDNEFAGKTPFQSTNLEEKSYALRLSKPGYKDLRDQFTVNRDRNGRIIRTLEKITGAIELISNPPGAAVRLNGKPVEGLTPLVLNAVPAGKNSLTLSKDGYADQSAEIVIEAENTKKITMELQRQMGSLSILVIPWGNIFIDQQLFKKEAQFRQKIDLGAGLHQLRVEHPTLGAYDKLIRVENDKITDVEVNFNKTHTVRVMAIDAQGSDINADILVDGKRTGERTPINLNLKTGTYTISVSRTGYMLADGPKIVTVDETIRKPLNFVLKKTNE
ncbi:MAG: PEGA domain-containing protein, partial [Calditrichaceae bacterium]